MALDRLKESSLPQVMSGVVADFADLFQKEMRLARAELSAKLTTKLQAGVWMLLAGISGLIAVLLVVQAVVFAIASQGIALHWASMIVACGVAIIATLFFAKGRSDAKKELAPNRTINQVKRDIAIVKEHLS